MLISTEKVNLQRQKEFDLAKAFAIVWMVMVHVYENITEFEYEPPTGFLDGLLQFLAGPLTAPVFMFAMGVGIYYSRRNTPKALALRGVKLFVFGYILNILRAGIPRGICFLLTDTWSAEDYIWLLFNVDILHFAGLAFLVMALFKKLNLRETAGVAVLGIAAVAFQIIGMLLAKTEITNTVAVYALGNLWYTDAVTCFPFLLWFIYPALGYIFATLLAHVADLNKFYFRLGIFSAIFFVIFGTMQYFLGYDLRSFFMLADDAFYLQDFISVTLTVPLILLVLSLFRLVRVKLTCQWLEDKMVWLSSNLNGIFIAQWIMMGIAYNLVVGFAWDYLPNWAAYPVGIVFLAVAVALVVLWRRLFPKKKA